MKKFENCLLVADVDGTLYEGGKAVEKNFERIKYFIENGGVFTIATGRAPKAAAGIYKEVFCNAPAITFDGAVIFDYEQNKALDYTEMEQIDKELFTRFAKQFEKVGLMVQNVDDIFTITENEIQKRYIKYRNLTQIKTRLSDIQNEIWLKAIFTADSDEEINSVISGAADFEFNGCHFVRTSERYYEYQRKDVNKGSSLEKLNNILGNRKTFAIGNYYNDLELLKAADVSAVVGDSPEDMKSIADFVTCDCKDGAVAEFIEIIESNKW